MLRLVLLIPACRLTYEGMIDARDGLPPVRSTSRYYLGGHRAWLANRWHGYHDNH